MPWWHLVQSGCQIFPRGIRHFSRCSAGLMGFSLPFSAVPKAPCWEFSPFPFLTIFVRRDRKRFTNCTRGNCSETSTQTAISKKRKSSGTPGMQLSPISQISLQRHAAGRDSRWTSAAPLFQHLWEAHSVLQHRWTRNQLPKRHVWSPRLVGGLLLRSSRWAESLGPF